MKRESWLCLIVYIDSSHYGAERNRHTKRKRRDHITSHRKETKNVNWRCDKNINAQRLSSVMYFFHEPNLPSPKSTTCTNTESMFKY